MYLIFLRKAILSGWGCKFDRAIGAKMPENTKDQWPMTNDPWPINPLCNSYFFPDFSLNIPQRFHRQVWGFPQIWKSFPQKLTVRSDLPAELGISLTSCQIPDINLSYVNLCNKKALKGLLLRKSFFYIKDFVIFCNIDKPTDWYAQWCDRPKKSALISAVPVPVSGRKGVLFSIY